MPMTTVAVREVADEAVRPMRHALWLGQWRVALFYGRLDDGVKGECAIALAHQNAKVTIDPEQHDDAKDVLFTLRHELLHLAIAYFEQARKVVYQFLQGDSYDAVDVAFTLGAEHAVSAVERILDGAGLSPKRLVARGLKEIGE